MDLSDTIDLMKSEDYKERFRAEYYQLKIRADKLAAMLTKLDNGELDFKPTCPRWLLLKQIRVMSTYLELLSLRANYENVIL